MVNDGTVHGPEDAIGNIRRTGDLQKMAACMNHLSSEGLEAELYTLAGPASNRRRRFRLQYFPRPPGIGRRQATKRDLNLTRMGCGPIVLPGAEEVKIGNFC